MTDAGPVDVPGHAIDALSTTGRWRPPWLLLSAMAG